MPKPIVAIAALTGAVTAAFLIVCAGATMTVEPAYVIIVAAVSGVVVMIAVACALDSLR